MNLGRIIQAAEQFQDVSGKNASGGKLYVFNEPSQTLTASTLYKVGSHTVISNPLTIDSNGQVTDFLVDSSKEYYIIVKNITGDEIFSRHNVTCVDGGEGSESNDYYEGDFIDIEDDRTINVSPVKRLAVASPLTLEENDTQCIIGIDTAQIGKDYNGEHGITVSGNTISGKNLEDADTELQANIDNEASTRASADTTLQANIDAEESARESADTTLQGNIDSEATTRASADTNLQTQIDTKLSDAPSDGKTYGRKDGAWSAISANITSDQNTILVTGGESTNLEASKYYLDTSTSTYVISDLVSNETEVTIYGTTVSATLSDYPTTAYMSIQYRNYTSATTYTEVTKTYEGDALKGSITIPTNFADYGLTSSVIKIVSASPSITSWSGNTLNVEVPGSKKTVQEKLVLGDNLVWTDTDEKTLDLANEVTLGEETSAGKLIVTEYNPTYSGHSEIGPYNIQVNNPSNSNVAEMAENHFTLSKSDGTTIFSADQSDVTLTSGSTTYSIKDAANLKTEVDSKLSSVSVDGTTITGDGTSTNPLKASTDMSSAYTLVAGTGITLTDNTTNKTTTISASSAGSSLTNWWYRVTVEHTIESDGTVLWSGQVDTENGDTYTLETSPNNDLVSVGLDSVGRLYVYGTSGHYFNAHAVVRVTSDGKADLSKGVVWGHDSYYQSLGGANRDFTITGGNILDGNGLRFYGDTSSASYTVQIIFTITGSKLA